MLVTQLFINIMEQENKFNGLDRRHVRQIIRRMMIQKVKPSGRVYDRKKFKKYLPFWRLVRIFKYNKKNKGYE